MSAKIECQELVGKWVEDMSKILTLLVRRTSQPEPMLFVEMNQKTPKAVK